MTLTDEQLERYARHITLKELGVEGQKKLLDSKVLMIGAGGLGAPAAMYLAAAGVGTIGIADFDNVDPSNLQRQLLHSTADVGRPKVRSAAETIRSINPDVNVVTYNTYVTGKNIAGLISGYDFILDCADNFPTKFLINDACVLARKPFCHAGVLRFEGQLMTYVPGHGPCYRCIFEAPPPEGEVPGCREVGIMGATAGVIGSMQALEAIKYITGQGELLTGSMLVFDGLKMEWRKVRLPKRVANCPVCGDSPTITGLTDSEQTS